MSDAHVNIDVQVRIREQVLDLITNISPVDRPFLAALKRQDATNTKVEWVKEKLAAADGTNAKVHGFAVTFATTDWSARTQDFNYTQLFERQASVDLSHEAVEKVGLGRGPKTELNHQKTLKLKEELNDIEASLVGAGARTQPQPNTTVAGVMNGAQTFITTNIVAAGSGDYPEATVQPAYYDDLAQKCWKQGGYPDKVFCGVQAKRAVSGWITQVNRPVSDSGKKLTMVVNQYETVVGMQDLILDRYLTNVLLMIETGRWQVAWLRQPMWYDIAQTGDFLGGYYAAELTLVALAENSSGKMTGLNYTA